MVEGLARDHERRTRAAPTDEERRALVDRWIEGELLYREALALGLDRGDTIVRRRMVQKMRFMLEADADGEEPRDYELEALLARAPDRWADPPRISFTHVFAPDGDAAELRARLDRSEDPARLGAPFPRGRVFSAMSEREIASAFGGTFAREVMALPTGAWSVPITSSFGLHLVRVDARQESAPPRLADIRARLASEWREQRRVSALRDGLSRLRGEYQVRAP